MRGESTSTHDVCDLGSFESLVFQERPGDQFHLVPILCQNVIGRLEADIDDTLHLGVNPQGSLFAVFLGTHHITTQEDVFLGLSVEDHAQLITHAPVHDHGFGHGGGLLDVSGGAARNIIREHLLGDSAGHGDGNDVVELFEPTVVYVFFRQVHRGAQGLTSRNDGHLVQGMSVLEHHIDHGVAGLMPGRASLFFFRHRHAAALTAPAHLVTSLFQLVHAYGFLAGPSRQQSRFIEQVGQFST